MQVFFRRPNGGTETKQLEEGFTLDSFIKTAGDVLGSSNRADIIGWRYTVGAKPLDVKNEGAFEDCKKFITKDCNILILGRLLGGYTFPEALHDIAEQGLEDELDKVATHYAQCVVCLDDEKDCIKVCCVWMCREAFKSWIRDKQFRMSCALCAKPIVPKDVFKTPEFIATLQVLEDEREVLKNIDCQLCLKCDALMHNETMYARQVCFSCDRAFCFFCNREWDTKTMTNQKNTCGYGCIYETMISFQLIDFHYNSDVKIPSQRTCPKCFNFGAYDRKCKYHTCTACKFTFCFLCLEEQKVCEKKYESSYDHVCVKAPIRQTYAMFPHLLSE
ncbi:hypothetical protein BGX21_010058 [Mortierella sp. AD011]|nr:hypothetical protein BGX20_003996 [Mortierella sp. AD010]KAF9402446.1 hypothetical protein BGX21_010058 [Mortierella sp. AD011]